MKSFFVFLGVVLFAFFANAQGSITGEAGNRYVGAGINGAYNGTMAGFYYSKSKGCKKRMYCVMAGQHVLQMGHAATTMFGAQDTGNDASNQNFGDFGDYGDYGDYGDIGGGSNIPNDICVGNLSSPTCQSELSDNGFSPGQIKQAAEIERAVRNAGYSIDPTTGDVTTPEGDIVPSSEFAASAMSGGGGGGYDPDFIKKMKNKAMKEAKAQAAVFKAKFGAPGGGGGGKRRKAASADLDNDFNFKFNSKGLLDRLRQKGSVEGMTRSLAGESIGVAGDNIFEMLSRRYQAKDRANHFLP